MAPTVVRTAARISPRQLIVAAVCGGMLLLGAASGAFWAMLVLMAFAAAVVGVIALVQGRVSWVGIRNRRIATVVVAASLGLMVVGGSASASLHPASTAPAAFVADAGAMRSVAPAPTPSPSEVVTEVVELVPIPFAAIEVEDVTIDVGQIVVTTAGVAGEQRNTYRVTVRDGVEVSRELVSGVVSIPAVAQVTSHGTRQPPPPEPAPVAEPASGACDPNYEGQCVPIASDVDCAGGGGNGPAFTPGPVYVVGTDIYGLDRDGDGIGCD